MLTLAQAAATNGAGADRGSRGGERAAARKPGEERGATLR